MTTLVLQLSFHCRVPTASTVADLSVEVNHHVVCTEQLTKVSTKDLESMSSMQQTGYCQKQGEIDAPMQQV